MEAKAALASHIGQTITDIYYEAINVQIANVQKQRDFELELAEGNADEQAKINEKYARKEAALKRKQAIADKLNALFQIAISTAVAIASASPVIPLMVFAGVVGAIQLALVAAKPIPAFKKGTKSSPEGMAITSEAGPELLLTPGGGVELTGNKGAEMRYLKRGTRVIPNQETESILSASAGYDSFEVMALAGVIRDENEKTRKTIRDKKEITIIPSKSKIIERQGKYFKEYLNAKV